MKDNNDQPKKRGRPRKSQTLEKQLKKETRPILTNQEREIILHLPLNMMDLNYKDNNFSENNDTDEDYHTQTMLTLSDGDDIETNKNYYDIMQELQEKDKTIRKLKDEILGYSSALTEYNNTLGEKENYVINMDIPIINHSNGQQIIPTETNICCWWCTYNFDTMPIFIPELFHDKKYYVFGCFCSFNCACAYNLNMNDYKIKDRHSLLMSFASIIYKNNIETQLFIAPTKEILEKYGGPVSITDYRKNFKTCTKEYRLIIPPMVSIIPTVEIITKEKPFISFKNEINKFSQSVEEKHGIFDCMKIKVKKN